MRYPEDNQYLGHQRIYSYAIPRYAQSVIIVVHHDVCYFRSYCTGNSDAKHLIKQLHQDGLAAAKALAACYGKATREPRLGKV